MRAISGEPHLEVSYTTDKPAMVGEEVRLPEPGRKMSAKQLSVLRGTGDAMALRKACHDTSLHSRLSPTGDNARAVYDAVEQARIEAIGSLQMPGISDNLAVMLEDKYSRTNFPSAVNRADVPLEDAVAMVVREKLTGREPPESAQNIVNLWREFIEQKAGENIEALDADLEDQAAFAHAVRELIRALDMGDELGDTEPDDSEDDGNDDPDGETEDSEKQNEQSTGQEESQPEDADAESDEQQQGETEAADADSDESLDDDENDTEQPGEAYRPELPFSQLPPESDYKVFSTEFDEVILAEELCDDAELDRLRSFLDKQLAHLQGVVGVT